MKYGAITLDTSIFKRNELKLEEKLLGQLVQFKEGPIKFIISEVVSREVYKHLKIEAKKAHDLLERASREFHKNKLFLPNDLEKINTLFCSARSAGDAVKSRLDAFGDATGMITIFAKQIDISELVHRYFQVLAPFEASASKRAEFPDAIALLSLEKWAEKEGKRILAVFTDKGWANYAKSSNCIDIEEDLAKALETLQQYTESSKVIINKLISSIHEGKNPKIHQKINDSLSEELNDWDADPKVEFAEYYEKDWLQLNFQSFQFHEQDNEYDFSIVRIKNNEIVVQIPITIKVKAECSITTATWDAYRGKPIPKGWAEGETENEFYAEILITFEGDFSAALSGIKMSSMELVEATDSIDFSEGDFYHVVELWNDEIE